MLAEANVPLTLHIGGELFFFRTAKWASAKAFEGFKFNEETSMDPWRLSVLHYAPQNFVATMITGGVFDRHPNLRVGVVEYGAHWVGPMAEMLDLWHDNNNSIGLRQFADGSVSRKLPMRPSEYLARNVRVSPFDFEPVGKYIARHRNLEDVYCFASDYPHVEGGKSPLKDFSESLEPLGSEVLEKFFVTNGRLLLPE
jgi:predicted TIM-barrel fold metal-dependent hydrolase